MGTTGKSIVKLDVDALIEKLNSALADEWLAYYQYWVGARVVKGPMRGEVEAELLQHATEELGHAETLAERILQLGGKPLLSPEDWFKASACGYAVPSDEFVKTILTQNIEGEQCAILTYNKLLEFIGQGDPITAHEIGEILEDEVEHEQDLQNLLEDLETFIK